MLQETKRDLMLCARKLSQPYESYSIDELADAYCEAVDTNNATLKDVYISALLLRFWYTIDKMYKANTVAPCLEYEDFFEWLYEAIEYACKYRGWKDPTKNLNAQQCINKCIETIKLQKYYNLRLDKNKTVNFTVSMDAPISGDSDDKATTVGDLLESEETWDDHSADDVMMLVQSYINRDKIIEAILIDNIAFNDVQKTTKQTVKDLDIEGNPRKYTKVYKEFWPYRCVQILSTLPADYATYFNRKYMVNAEEFDTALSAVRKATNQKLYRYVDKTLADARGVFAR